MEQSLTCIKRGRSLFTRCRCEDCRPGSNRMRKIYNHGRYIRPAPEVAMRVLDWMIAETWDSYAIASAVGVPHDTASWWIQQRKKGNFMKLGPLTCQLIMDHQEPTEGNVAPTVAQRQLQALARLGWSLPYLAGLIGPTVASSRMLGNIRAGRDIAAFPCSGPELSTTSTPSWK